MGDQFARARNHSWLAKAGVVGQAACRFSEKEIEDVGKSEQRELASRMAVLMSQLLKWCYQPERRSASWQRTIKEQRRALAFHLTQVPSLQHRLAATDWMDAVWADAVSLAIAETGMDTFPEACPWAVADIPRQDWLPGLG